MNLKNLAVVRKRAVRNSFSPAFARVCSLVTIHGFVRKKNVRSQHATVLVILQRKNIKISKISMCLTCWQLVLEVVLEQSATIPVVRRLGQGAIVLPTDWISVLRKGRERKQFRVTPGNTRDPHYLSGSQEWRTVSLTFRVCKCNSEVWPFERKLLCREVFPSGAVTLESLDESPDRKSVV